MNQPESMVPGGEASRCREKAGRVAATPARRRTTKTRRGAGASRYAVPVFRVELVTERHFDAPVVTTPGEIAVVLQEFLARCDREHFVVVMLATSGRIIGINVVHVGSLSASIVNVREVFKPAILSNAATVIVAHNHPSGNLEPSAEDLRISRQLKEAGRMLEIQVLDSLIVAQGGYTSLAERGMLT